MWLRKNSRNSEHSIRLQMNSQLNISDGNSNEQRRRRNYFKMQRFSKLKRTKYSLLWNGSEKQTVGEGRKYRKAATVFHAADNAWLENTSQWRKFINQKRSVTFDPISDAFDKSSGTFDERFETFDENSGVTCLTLANTTNDSYRLASAESRPRVISVSIGRRLCFAEGV